MTRVLVLSHLALQGRSGAVNLQAILCWEWPLPDPLEWEQGSTMTLTLKLPVLKPPAGHWGLWSIANHNLPASKHLWESPGGNRHRKCAHEDVWPTFWAHPPLTWWDSCQFAQQLGF